MRIVVSGGGTAGHISPILATVEALRKLEPEAEFLYVGMAGGMEESIAEGAGLEFKPIKAGKFRRYHKQKLYHRITDLSTIGLNIRDSGRLVMGLAASLGILKRWEPDIVFIKGGYVGLPVGLAARLLRIPYIIHESDTIPGLTNRLLAKSALRIATGFPVDRYKDWPADKLIYTGSPIRAELGGKHRLEGLAAFGFDQSLPVVLVVGGSQGAQRVNEAVLLAIPELVKRCQVIHVTGERDIEHVRFSVNRMPLAHPERYVAAAFLSDKLAYALAAADIVVSRAGANSIAELAALGKPTILIPNPHLVGGHQPANAQVLARADAVRIITEAKLSGPAICREIFAILDKTGESERLSLAIKEFAKPKAAIELARTILDAAGQGRTA